ncbi:hypothetical protein FPQ10_06070 [Allobacillus sp. SKP2-8]|uniref:hypothetical protein n=1 Tax=unclassified Allobacillus TaxID=2628859 RepID=UPI001182A4CF|nr:hypothetical protein [Allobacillus sp. SKP2-8]TSJ67361.1 hypothetical protein FPQ10_06070 [Allobacillus sp. SKP2-8]
MNINFTNKQYETLLEVAYLGEWIANAGRIGDQQIEKYNELLQYIGTFAKEFNQSHSIEYDQFLGGYFPTTEYEEQMHPIIKEYDELNFWERLSDRLTKRDIEQSGKTFTSRKEYFELYAEIRKKYEIEFSVNGVRNLVIKEYG